jgi:hypothetical protein
VLTVAVSVAAGVAALTSAFRLYGHRVLLGMFFIAPHRDGKPQIRESGSSSPCRPTSSS